VSTHTDAHRASYFSIHMPIHRMRFHIRLACTQATSTCLYVVVKPNRGGFTRWKSQVRILQRHHIFQELTGNLPENPIQPHRFLIFDRDAKFSADVVAAVKQQGTEPVRTAFRR